MARVKPYSPKPPGKLRVDPKYALNEIRFINRNGCIGVTHPKNMICLVHYTIFGKDGTTRAFSRRSWLIWQSNNAKRIL